MKSLFHCFKYIFIRIITVFNARMTTYITKNFITFL